MVTSAPKSISCAASLPTVLSLATCCAWSLRSGHGPHSPWISPPPWQPLPWPSPAPPLLSGLQRWHGGSPELPLPLWSVIQPRDGKVSGDLAFQEWRPEMLSLAQLVLNPWTYSSSKTCSLAWTNITGLWGPHSPALAWGKQSAFWKDSKGFSVIVVGRDFVSLLLPKPLSGEIFLLICVF